MDEPTGLLITDTKVERREDGIVVTFIFEDESEDAFYFSQAEARDIVKQLDRQLQHCAEVNP